VSPLLLSFVGFVTLLLGVFLWAMGRKRRHDSPKNWGRLPEESGHRHVSYMPQIRQAMSGADKNFLLQKSGSKLARRVQGERRAIALRYVNALQSDFSKLVQQAKAIALLSPEVVAVHEFERVRLSLEFSIRCKTIRARILFGTTPLSQLSALSDLVSGLTVRIEAAMREIGERAAAASALASPLDGGGVDVT
jgi:hypothetical protein